MADPIDGSVEVRITGAVDPSLAASATEAKSIIGSLSQADREQLNLRTAMTKQLFSQENTLSAESYALQKRMTAQRVSEEVAANKEIAAAAKAKAAEEDKAAAASFAFQKRMTAQRIEEEVGRQKELAAAALVVAGAQDIETTSMISGRVSMEAFAAIHEVLQHRYSRLAGTSVILAQAMAGQEASTSLLSAALSPLGLAVIAVSGAFIAAAIAGAQYEEAQRKIVASSLGVGAASTFSAEQVRQLGDAAAETSDRSVAASEASAEAFAAAGIKSGSEIIQLSGQLDTYAALVGEKAPAAQKQLDEAMSGSISKIKEMNDSLNFLSGDELSHIETLSREGDSLDAQTQLYIALKDRMDDAQQSGVGLATEWQADIKWLSDMWTWLGKVNQELTIFTTFGLGDKIKQDQAAADSAAARQKVIAGANKITDAGEAAWEKTPEGQIVKHREELVGAYNAAAVALTVLKAVEGDHTQEIARMGIAISDYAKQIAELDDPIDKEKKEPKPRKGRADTGDPVAKEIQADTDEWQHWADMKVEIDQNVDEDLLEYEIAFWQKKKAAATIGTAEWYAIVEKLNPLLVQGYENDVKAITEMVDREIAQHRRGAEEEKKFDDEAVRVILANEKQIEDAHKRTAEAAMRAWKEANSEILSAENELVAGILNGRTNLGQLLENIVLRTAEKEIEADIRYWTERKLLQAEGIAVENSKEEGGFILHLLTEQKKTAATAQGAASRAAVENSGFFAQMITKLASLLGIHIATEKTKTAATVTAASARAGASGVASFAEAPWPTDVGAPAFGASMASAAAGFGSLAVLAQGTNYVPNDQLAYIHEGEGVLPKADNQAMRDAVARGTGGGSGIGTIDLSGDTHIHTSSPNGPDIISALADHRSKLADLIDGAVRGGWTSKNASPYKR